MSGFLESMASRDFPFDCYKDNKTLPTKVTVPLYLSGYWHGLLGYRSTKMTQASSSDFLKGWEDGVGDRSLYEWDSRCRIVVHEQWIDYMNTFRQEHGYNL